MTSHYKKVLTVFRFTEVTCPSALIPVNAMGGGKWSNNWSRGLGFPPNRRAIQTCPLCVWTVAKVKIECANIFHSKKGKQQL